MERPQSAMIPATPGIYIYKNAEGHILYVGKARNLRKRVLSYFRESGALTPKTVAMLSHACEIETLSTTTEKEALLLESSLIKKHRPHYNIVLRDDKQYVLFRIGRETVYPRLEIVRQTKKDNARYFGPFTSGMAARETWKSIHRVFPLRRCADRAFKNRVRPCLYHHLGQCLAPCAEAVAPEEYAGIVHRVELLLSGRSRELLDGLRQGMTEASEALEYERAASFRDQIRAVERTLERQSVVLPEGGNMDVAGIAPARNGLGLGLLFVREGRLVDGRTFFWPGLELADGPELLWSFLGQYYGSQTSIPPRLVVPWLPDSGERELLDTEEDLSEVPLAALESTLTDFRGGSVRITVPRNAVEIRLVDMAASNARESALAKDDKPMAERLATVFRSVLHSATTLVRPAESSLEESSVAPAEKTIPPLRRVECVDVSHTGGTATRVGMVVFEDGQAQKSAYRTYKLEGASACNGDDYAALAEWMRHRLESGPPWADLVLIDGGRGQVSAVQRVVRESGVEGLFLLAGIAKARDEQGKADRRAGNVGDRIFVPGRSNPLPLRDGSAELLFLQHVRDTAHHFVLGRHRQARSGAALSGELMRIPGVGKATARLLWDHFKTFEAMTQATPENLAALPGIGSRKATALVRRLKEMGS